MKSSQKEKNMKVINPVEKVKVVHIDNVVANDYNPNSVPKRQMELLYISIKEDGFTQPIVTIYDKSINKYIIVDGFHRYSVMKTYKDIYELNEGMLPIVVIEKDLSNRIASTIRHNRARGKHAVENMSSIVFKLLKEGWTDADIMKKIGMKQDELTKLKHITGFSKIFAQHVYSKAQADGLVV